MTATLSDLGIIDWELGVLAGITLVRFLLGFRKPS